MNTLKRFKNIIHSNVNSALDSMEDPEKMIKLMIHDLEEALLKVKKSQKEKSTEKKVMEKEMAELQERIERWTSRSRLAVEQGRDDLAKEAIMEKRATEHRIAQLKENIKNLESIIMSEDESISQLTEKLKEITLKQDTLLSRARHAKEKQAVRQTLKETDSWEISEKFNELEAKIEQMESDAHISGADTDSAFVRMEREKEADEELAKLKEQLKKEQD
ncbi:MAG: PspA/IM30 family protein [Spirochaetia bacterium]|jgi:phage shock protein A|nr:PspA/IM30 family protein [Spirochaetia bacterium]